MKPAHAFKVSLKASLIALSIAAISPAHATGVPTVDGSAIISNLQQWYQSAQRWYSQMQSMAPGEFAANLLGLEKATSQADSYIAALEKVKTQMQDANPCKKYPVEASKMLCTQEEDLKVQMIDAYIAMLNAVKEDYDALYKKVDERNKMAAQFALGDLLTGGGDTKEGELKALDVQINDLRQRLGTNMQQNSVQIDMAEKRVKIANNLRVVVARGQFEGNTDGLSSLITKGAVITTLSSAASKYDEKTKNIKNQAISTTGQTGTDY